MKDSELSKENTVRELRMVADDLEKGCGGFNWLIGFDFSGGYQMSLQEEINRLKNEFKGSDENKINALEGMIEQAAYERIYLKRLNEQAILSGLVEFHPENAKLQRTLPISGEIAKHSASYSNIMDKLMKHLAVESDDEDDELGEYE